MKKSNKKKPTKKKPAKRTIPRSGPGYKVTGCLVDGYDFIFIVNGEPVPRDEWLYVPDLDSLRAYKLVAIAKRIAS